MAAAVAAYAGAAIFSLPPSLNHPHRCCRRFLLPHTSIRLPLITSRLYSSRSNGSMENHSSSSSPSPSPSSDDEEEKNNKHKKNHPEISILHHALPCPAAVNSFNSVFVTLPKDAVSSNGKVTRRKALAASFAALASTGVEGITMELWWGVVERADPGAYDWAGYLDLVALASRFGLKVRAIMAFHGDPQWVPLPWWVLEEMDKVPDLAFSDRFGRRNNEYLSLGCDTLPVLKGRSPIQAYSDFMRSFRDTFRDFLGVIVTEVQVGMGPAGELRYPSVSSEKLQQLSTAPELGEFQCYDKHMLASLSACARKVGMAQWGSGGPLSVSSLLQDPEETSFFRSDGSWNTSYGRFFLEWYSGMLLLHGERLCSVTQAIFLSTGLEVSAKVAGIHWHYYTCSHPSELTAGYYNTLTRNGYLPIIRMFSRYHMKLCCPCFDKRDPDEPSNSKSSPELYIKQLVNAAKICSLPLSAEISATRLDDASLKQVIKSSRLYSDGTPHTALSFNYVRMDKSLFEAHNWNHFTRFVRQMSDTRTFRAKLCRRTESCISCTSVSDDLRRAFACR